MAPNIVIETDNYIEQLSLHQLAAFVKCVGFSLGWVKSTLNFI